MTTAASHQIVPRPPPSAPALRAADRGAADALESVLSENTRRVYGAQWRIFTDWCDEVGLRSLPADPLTVARYLAVRAGSGASIATLRLATSAIAKAHQLAGHESPGRDPGVRASLKGWGRRLARPQRQAGALTADTLAVIRLTAVQPRRRGRSFETAEQAAQRGMFDVALWWRYQTQGYVVPRLRLSPGATCSAGTTAAAGITVVRSKTDVEAAGAVAAITPPPCVPWTCPAGCASWTTSAPAPRRLGLPAPGRRRVRGTLHLHRRTLRAQIAGHHVKPGLLGVGAHLCQPHGHRRGD